MDQKQLSREIFHKITNDIMSYPPNEHTLASASGALAYALVTLITVGVGREHAPELVSRAINRAFEHLDERAKKNKKQ